MSYPNNVALIERFYADLWNGFDKTLIPVLLTEDLEFRGSLGATMRGHAQFADYMDFVRAAFPDFTNTVEEVVSEGDRSFARLTYRGTHRGELYGIPATGRPVEYAGAALFRFRDGRIAAVWVLGDVHGLVQQLRGEPGKSPGEDEQRVIQFLDGLLYREPVRAFVDDAIQRVEQRLQDDPTAVMAWEPVPLDLYGTPLPGSIQSSWVFILRANVATGAERHPNSRQRMLSYRGSGDLQTKTKELWDPNPLTSDPAAPLDRRWISIPENVWHQAVTPEANWVVVSFHTVPAEELVEERPNSKESGSTHRKKYVEMMNEERTAAKPALAGSSTGWEPTRNDLGQCIGFSLRSWVPPPVPPRESMEGRFCRLEPLDPDRHAAALFEADAADTDGRSWTYLPYGPFSDLPSYRAWMDASCLGGDPLFFAVIDRADGRPAGLVSYLRIAPAAGSIEVGHIHYAPRLQRSPAATEAMYLMMKQAFESRYRRYEWKCDALNAASRRAARRLGLSFEGVFRQATVYKGRNRDTAWYAAVDAEWPALRAAFLAWLAPDNFDGEGHQRARLSDLTRPILQRLG